MHNFIVSCQFCCLYVFNKTNFLLYHSFIKHYLSPDGVLMIEKLLKDVQI